MTDEVPNETNSTPGTAFEPPPGSDGTGKQPQQTHTRNDGGRRLVSDPFPRLLMKEGPKRAIADFEQTLGVMIVSEKFRLFLEALEPGVHQFEPVRINWGDGTHAADMFILVICTALDSVAADHVEGQRELIDYGYEDGIKRLGPWADSSGRRALRLHKMIFGLRVIGSNCLWQDEFLVSGPFCSDVFRKSYDEAGLKGAGFGQLKAV